MCIRMQRKKSYIPKYASSTLYVNKSAISPTGSDDGRRPGDIAMRPVNYNSMISVCYYCM